MTIEVTNTQKANSYFDIDVDMRTDALKITAQLVGNKLFKTNTEKDMEPWELELFYELAQYNYKFLKGEPIDIDNRTSGERVIAERQQRTQRALGNV